MFNFTTTTILNSLEDYTTGKPLISADTTKKVVHIKRDLVLESKWVDSVYKRTGYKPQLCEMEVNLTKAMTQLSNYCTDVMDGEPVSGSLNFYIALEGSEEHLYANDWYQKGKPFAIGFQYTKNMTAVQLAAQLTKNINKWSLNVYGKKMFELIDTKDGKLTLKGTHEHQRINRAAILVNDGVYDSPIADWEWAGYDNAGKDQGNVVLDVFTLNKRGVNGFGTYSQLTKDLRLPTAAHTNWTRIQMDETPIVGAIYTQYIITYYAPVQSNPSLTSVGNRSLSETTHIFWVNNSIVSAFETAMDSILDGMEEIDPVPALKTTAYSGKATGALKEDANRNSILDATELA